VDTQLGARQGRADPGGLPRSRSTFREGGLEGLREWNPNRPVSEIAADRDLIRESFEKQPVRTVAEACKRRALCGRYQPTFA